jgi:hypothetical protein
MYYVRQYLLRRNDDLVNITTHQIAQKDNLQDTLNIALMETRSLASILNVKYAPGDSNHDICRLLKLSMIHASYVIKDTDTIYGIVTVEENTNA